ncbi:unnamed protein product [Mytilus edulis]|uniref:C-type lectin domain-containing protein n=1 Tax=Mytilus edulis TaxID=6550 RepID=A0A8S3SQZ6_MYTED|nr:unnamed protein product [Mytilus edulis]
MTYLITVPHECTTKLIEGFVRLPQYDNKYVTTGILWILDVDSKHFCAIECNMDALCVSFFYGNNICSGYDKNYPDAGNVQILSGNSFYQKRGLPEDYKCAPGKLGPNINKCYWTTPTPLTWADTGTQCGTNGGILATFPDNTTYYIILNGTGILDSTDYWWIGLTDVVTEAVFKTSDGKAMPWDNLVALYGYFTDDCLAIAPLENFKWAEEHCSTSAYRGV